MKTTGRYWLMKSEPLAFSIDDLAASPGQQTCWDGVRNYQARNYMRAMQIGDRVLFYHSSAEPPAVVGIAEVVRTAYPDDTAFQRGNKHYDPKSQPSKPIWDMVDIKLVKKFPRPLGLDFLKEQAPLKRMELLRKGSRLSVQPVKPEEWKEIVRLANE
jgi:predicted RNA-binding protein with PUA-like domain